MSKVQTLNMAEEIAKLIIDKSFWGNEWFIFFSLLLVGLVSALSAWGGSYLSTRAQNRAMRSDFNEALSDIKTQTETVKRIEEDISHNYQEKREILKIKRDKIEEIYLALSIETDALGSNLTIAAADEMRGVSLPSNKVGMLLGLYFRKELEKELDYYLEQRKILITRIRELCQENLQGKARVNQSRISDNMVYFKNFNQSKVNIELGLEELMQNLTSQGSRTATPSAA